MRLIAIKIFNLYAALIWTKFFYMQ